jgi:hypothetical protein
MCPVILYLLFRSVFKACLERLVLNVGELVRWCAPVSRKRKKKKCLHRERRARAKARVKKFWRQALSVALVVHCRRRSSNKPSTLKHLESTSKTSEPVHWNGGREWLVWTPSSQDLSCPPLTVFVRLVTTFYVCHNYCVLSAITIITQTSSSRRSIELPFFMVLMRCISQPQTILIPRL